MLCPFISHWVKLYLDYIPSIARAHLSEGRRKMQIGDEGAQHPYSITGDLSTCPLPIKTSDIATRAYIKKVPHSNSID